MIENAEIVEGGDGDGVVAAGSVVAIRYEGDDDDRALPARLDRGAARRPRGHLARVAARRGADRPRAPATPSSYETPTGARARGRDRLGRGLISGAARRGGSPSAAAPAVTSSCPGRGTTFVRELPGPPGAPDGRCCCTAGPPPPTSTGSPCYEPLAAALPGGRPSTTAATAGASAPARGSGSPTAPTTPPRCSTCSASSPVDRGRLLDGRPDRPAALAPPPRHGWPGSCCARRPTGSRPAPARAGPGWAGCRCMAAHGAAHAGRRAAEPQPSGAVAARGATDPLSEWVTERDRPRRPARAAGGGRPPSAASTPGRGSATSTCPTAVVLTEHDNVVPPRRQRRLAAAIPGAEVFPVAGDHARLRRRRTTVRARAARRAALGLAARLARDVSVSR